MRVVIGLLGALTLRVIGLVALVSPAIRYAYYVHPALSGGEASAIRSVFHDIAVPVVFLAIAIVTLIPPFSRRVFRRHPRPVAHTARSVLWLFAIVYLFQYAAVDLMTNAPGYGDLGHLLWQAMPAVLLAFLVLFFIPGSYASELARPDRSFDLKTARVKGSAEISGPQATDAQAADLRARVMARQRAKPKQREVRGQGRSSLVPTSPLVFLVLLLAFGFVAVGLYGYFEAQFLPTSELVTWAEDMRWRVVGIGAGLVAVATTFAPERNAAVASLRPTGRGLIGALVGAALFGALPVAALSIGLPGLHSLIVGGNAATERVVVTEIGPGIRRGCNYVLQVRPTGDLDPGPRQLCDVPREIWDGARPGQTLILTGVRTDWGFRYSVISR